MGRSPKVGVNDSCIWVVGSYVFILLIINKFINGYIVNINKNKRGPFLDQ